MNSRRAARIAVAAVSVFIVGCAPTSNDRVESALEAAPDPATTYEPAPATPTGEYIAPGPETHGLLDTWYETFDEVVEVHPVVVIVRATDTAWRERPPGSDPAAIEDFEDRLPRDGSAADDFYYLWREFEVLEVLHGEYEGVTLNRGGFLDRTEAGKTYVLFTGVIRTEDGDYWRSEEYLGAGIPPYEVTDDELMVSTDPEIQQKLPATIALDEFRDLIGDVADG